MESTGTRTKGGILAPAIGIITNHPWSGSGGADKAQNYCRAWKGLALGFEAPKSV